MANEDHKEASKTYLEQTKLLIALASSFIVAPAVLFKDLIELNLYLTLLMELCYVSSVILGYVVVGTITGEQFNGTYNVYRSATRNFSIAQLATYLIGLGVLIFIFLHPQKPTKAKGETKLTDTIYVSCSQKMPDTVFFKTISSSNRHYRKQRRASRKRIADSCRCKCN